MKDFTIFNVWSPFPHPWPPSKLEQIFLLPYDDGAVQVWAHPDGHIEVVAGSADATEPTRAHFQRVQTPDRSTAAVVGLTNAAGVLGLTLNGTSLASLSDAGDSTYLLPFSQPPARERSIGHPDARTACARWISERQRRFSEKKPFKPKPDRKRVSKTTSRQAEELHESAQMLRDSIRFVATGAKHHLPSIAGVMRSLVYWPNLNPTWNPLLLRLANVRQLGLPVFGFEPAEGPPKEGLVLHIQNLAPSITREFKGQSLMDLEAYLSLQLVLATREDGQTSTLSVGETLGSIASSQGASHYDETIDLDIHRLNQIVTVRTALTERIMVRVAGVVAELADHIVSKLRD